MARVYNNVLDHGGEAAAGGGGGRRHIRDKPSRRRGRNSSGPERCPPCPQPSQVNRPPPRQARGSKPAQRCHHRGGKAGGARTTSATAAAPPQPGNDRGRNRDGSELCSRTQPSQVNRPPPRQARGTRPQHQLVGNAGGALARSVAAAAAPPPPRPGNSGSLGVLCFSVFYKQWGFSLSYSPRN